jgi:hypothetical protein
MRAIELKIGNYVTDGYYDSFKTIFEVESISEKGINLSIKDDGRWGEIADIWIEPEYEFDLLFGIPLTEEWLLKFGFTKYEWMNGYFIKTFFGDLMIQFFKDEIHLFFTKVSIDSKGMMFDGRRFAGNKKSFTKVKYLHQLQNLYFSLTGEELTIKNK